MSSRRSRSSRVRSKVAALLISLAALWAFAAFVTLREGINLLYVKTLDEGVATPLETLVPALQNERRLTMVYLGGHTEQQRRSMTEQRAQTDVEDQSFRRLSSTSQVSFAGSDDFKADLAATYAQLGSLAAIRQDIDDGHIMDRTAAAARFTAIVDTIFTMYESLGELDDKRIAADVRTLVDLTRAREVLSQEDALTSGSLAAGAFTGSERDRFAQLVGTRRFLRSEAIVRLPAPDRTTFTSLLNTPAFTSFELLEDRIMGSAHGGSGLPVTLPEWTAAVQPVFDQDQTFVHVAGDSLVARAQPVAIGVIVRLALAGGLGLIAVIASIIISITTARALVRQLERLRNAARDLSSYRLPRVVERLQHGEKVDVEHEAPPLDFGRDEIGQVGQAFNAVQETAIRVAVEQAELRRSVRDVFLSLARRSQALLHRQLGLLDAMERRATDAEELAELFRVDHLATRMRRNAENLIVLSGATAGRAWRKPVPMVDVLRGALAEVEDYTRVTVLPVGPASLVGRAVGDVIHLLAELIENAVSFSPPQTVVRVGGSVVGNGFAIEIEDRGLGMSEEDRLAANEQLNDPPEFKLSSTARLGLYVVGKLAERHGIRVRLTESPYGGTTAIVLLPATLMAEESAEDLGRLGEFNGSALALGTGRHRSADEPVPAAVGSAPGIPAQIAAAAADPVSDGHSGAYTPPAFVAPAEPPLPVPPLTAAPPAAPPTALPNAAPIEPAAPTRRTDPPVLTPSGLPFRQRDPAPGGATAAAASPRAEPGGPAASPPSNGQGPLPDNAAIGRAGRAPDDMRSIMASYRSGTLRGRMDAARLVETDEDSPEWTAPTPESHDTEEEG
jgi:signal transduction histidine kinase